MSSHLTFEERDRIVQWLGEGHTRGEIARRLGRSPSTISRELRRNRGDGEYGAAAAQRMAEQRRRARPLERKTDRAAVNETVRELLSNRCSPDEIAARMKWERPDRPRDCVSASTIDRWIARQGAWRSYWQGYLRRRGRPPWKPREKPRDPRNARISSRPAVVERRARLGDFEGDLVLGKPGTGGLATFVDRKSRFAIMFKVTRKDAEYVYRKARDRLAQLPDDQCHTLTLDNGGEFAKFGRLVTSLGMKVYSADPGRPCQRGTSENTNGLARQFFPKGSDFRTVTHADARAAEQMLNHRPRACLGYRTPHEVFHGVSTPLCCDGDDGPPHPFQDQFSRPCQHCRQA